MNVKILMDSDVKLDDERVEPSSVGTSGKEYGASGEIEVSANREKCAYSILHEFEHEAVLQTTLNISGENRNLPRRELVGISRLGDALRKPDQQKLVHLLAHSVRARGDETVLADVGSQLIERLQYFHAGIECRAHVSLA